MITAPNDNIEIAESYYKAVIAKDFNRIEHLLQPDVHFIGPLAELDGKADVLDAIRGCSAHIKGISIRCRFESDDKAMLATDVDFGDPMGTCRTAVMMTIRAHLISRIELFYDGPSCRKEPPRATAIFLK